MAGGKMISLALLLSVASAAPQATTTTIPQAADTTTTTIPQATWSVMANGEFCDNFETLNQPPTETAMTASKCGVMASTDKGCNPAIVVVKTSGANAHTVCNCAVAGDDCTSRSSHSDYAVYLKATTTTIPQAADTTTTTIPQAAQYHAMAKGECCCPIAQRIATEAECRSALDALGVVFTTIWSGNKKGKFSDDIPGGCSTKQDGRPHWNVKKNGEQGEKEGQARSDMTPICRGQAIAANPCATAAPVPPPPPPAPAGPCDTVAPTHAPTTVTTTPATTVTTTPAPTTKAEPCTTVTTTPATTVTTTPATTPAPKGPCTTVAPAAPKPADPCAPTVGQKYDAKVAVLAQSATSKKESGMAPAWAFPLFGVVAMFTLAAFFAVRVRKNRSTRQFQMVQPEPAFQNDSTDDELLMVE